MVLAAGAIVLPQLLGETEAATGLALRDKATQVANRNHPNAQLLEIDGHEGPRLGGTIGEDPEYNDRFYDEALKDGKIGDGKARVWKYFFDVEGSEDFLVILDAQGDVLHTGSNSTDSDVPLTNVKVDSNEAVEVAGEYDEEIENATAIGYFLTYGTKYNLENPTWIILRYGELRFVDARTGEYIPR